MLSDGERYRDRAVVQPIAAQWVEQRSVDLMAEPQPAGLMVVLRFEAPTAELRFEAPYMVGVPTMAGIVPTLALQRGSRLGRLPVRLRLRPIAIRHPIAHRHPITSPGSMHLLVSVLAIGFMLPLPESCVWPKFTLNPTLLVSGEGEHLRKHRPV
jgi:hypothetical protein